MTSQPDMDELLRSSDQLFRLETLDRYSTGAEDEDYGRWSRGEPQPPVDGDPWFDKVVRATTLAGKQWRRVHMLRLPLTDYLRFELEYGYTRSEQAGERVYILEVAQGAPLPLPPVDFWLFGDDVAVRMDYDSDGSVLDRVLVTDRSTVEQFRRRRDLALSRATPFPAWFGQAQEAGLL